MNWTRAYWNGEVEVSVEPLEMRMSHTVYAPRCVDISTGRILFDLTGTLWDLISVSEDVELLTFQMRKYGDGLSVVTVLLHRKGRVIEVRGTPVGSTALKQVLDEAIG